ncbi:MAG: uroporphyrinogen decarboxylase family protein [Planctomycetota bacterium]|jgi:uroporphyrinogen decarboxylase|nr:uroporphyrinogen decarboxylase family protein [Planctomycetota bacterium]
MTNKEIILSAIAGKPAERNAATLMSAGLWSFARRGLKLQDALYQPELAADVLASTIEEIQGDMVYAATGYYQLLPRALGAKIKFRPNGVPDLDVPVFADPSQLDPSRLDRIAGDEGLNFLWETAGRLAKRVGQKFLVACGSFVVLTVGGQIVSVEQLMRALRRDAPAANAVLDYALEACWGYLEPFLRSGSELVSLADPTASGDMISRRYFADFIAPRHKILVDRIHARGAKVMLHICGDVNDRINLMRDSGVDVLSLDFKVDLAPVREQLRGRAAFAGNLDPVRVMLQATPDEIRRLGRESIKKYGGDHNYILMPGCDIPGTVPLENVKALLAAARETN